MQAAAVTGLELAFRVSAVPKPQGSKRAFVTQPKEGSGKKPRAVIVDSDKAPLREFREAVRSDAVAAQPPGWTPLIGPVTVVLAFALQKPKVAERGPRRWPIGKTSGDLDKLTRAVLDALTDAAVFGDDGQVVRLVLDKDYPGTPEAAMQISPGVAIRVMPRYPAGDGETHYDEGTLL